MNACLTYKFSLKVNNTIHLDIKVFGRVSNLQIKLKGVRD